MFSLKGLLFFLIALLWLPLITRYLPVQDTELHGVTEKVVKHDFTFATWLDGSFQKKRDTYFTYNLGFRKAAVRLSNEIDYQLGEQRKYCVVGKRNNLMGMEYIDSYYGKDFIGIDSVNAVVSTILKFKEMLNRNGVAFFVVLAPSKTRLHPEQIPDEFRKQETVNTNYSQFLKAFKKTEIPTLDFQDWFASIETKLPYPVYSNLGVHWSNYAATIAADSLMGYIGQITGQRTNRIKSQGLESIMQAEGTERDMLDILNLYSSIPLNGPLGKINTVLQTDTINFSPTILAVGDSYYWNIIYTGIQEKFFKPGSAYYYYNSTAYFNNGVTIPVSQINVVKSCLTKNVVFLIYTEANLKNIGNGIAKQFIDAYATKIDTLKL